MVDQVHVCIAIRPREHGGRALSRSEARVGEKFHQRGRPGLGCSGEAVQGLAELLQGAWGTIITAWRTHENVDGRIQRVRLHEGLADVHAVNGPVVGSHC